jgi:hypothetical protein
MSYPPGFFPAFPQLFASLFPAFAQLLLSFSRSYRTDWRITFLNFLQIEIAIAQFNCHICLHQGKVVRSGLI